VGKVYAELSWQARSFFQPLFAWIPVGPRPYKLKKWRSQEKIELSSNRDIS
jgi:hypothetical protein